MTSAPKLSSCFFWLPCSEIPKKAKHHDPEPGCEIKLFICTGNLVDGTSRIRNLKPKAQNQERNIQISKLEFWKCQIPNPQLKVEIPEGKINSPKDQNRKLKIRNLKSKSQNQTFNVQNSQLKIQNPLLKLQLPMSFVFFEIVCRPKWHK